MKAPILFLLLSLFSVSQVSLASADEILLNAENISIPAMNAGEEVTLIRTARTPEKVSLNLAANAVQQVCARYDTRYVLTTSPQCGYDYTYVNRCHIEQRCIVNNHHQRVCRNEQVCHLDRISHMRTCSIAETYCASYRPVATVVSDEVKVKFKNGNLRDGEEESYVLRMGVKNNYSSPSVKAELLSLEGDSVKKRALSGNFVVKD